MSDAPQISVNTAQIIPTTPPSEWKFAFWLHGEAGKHEVIEAREVEREGDRYFVLSLPDGIVRRCCQRATGAFEWVESIPGGDPE